MVNQREQWLDSVKGIGILAVVVGHVWSPSGGYMNWFHMPLFFLVGGYLYRPKPFKTYFIAKFRSLLVPYISFLCILTVIHDFFAIKDFIIQLPNVNWYEAAREIYYKLYGGQVLTVWFGVFWFITCFFLTQQLYNLLYQNISSQYLLFSIIVLLYTFAIINDCYYQTIYVPWNANVVFISILFFYVGHQHMHRLLESKSALMLSSIILIICIIVKDLSWIDLTFEMKFIDYGYPVLSCLLAISCVVIISYLTKQIYIKSLMVSRHLSIIGMASMVIMFLHQPIQYSLRDNDLFGSDIIRIIISLIVPIIIFTISAQKNVLRHYILGIRKLS